MRAAGIIALMFCIAVVFPSAQAAESVLGRDSRTKTMLTLYGNGLALIRDVRAVSLSAGAHQVAFEGVSRKMIPASASILAPGNGLAVRELVYDFDVISAKTLLDRFVGREVGVVRIHPITGDETVEMATVLAAEAGLVLRYRDRIETGAPGRIVFSEAPADLRAFPTLVAALDLGDAVSEMELRYLSEGMTWSTDYVITLDDEASTLALEGRATLANVTGVDFANAEVALIAGQVNRTSLPVPVPEMVMARAADAAPAMASAAPLTREAFADLHLYTLPAPVELSNQQTKQIALMGADGIAFRRSYVAERSAAVYNPVRGEPTPVQPSVYLSFENTTDNQLSEPLPAGLARIFSSDAAGNVRLVGEDRIEHTATGRTIELAPGKAFDISVTYRQTDFKRLSDDNRLTESAWEIKIENAKADLATVSVVERLSGDWEITEESASHEKTQADRAEWRIDVPAGESAALTYRVRVRR